MSPKQQNLPAFTDTDGQPLQLSLYMFDGCPFCARVIDGAERLGLTLNMHDIRKDPKALAELLRVGGKKTVPCLFINGRALYESQDILAYLASQVRPRPQQTT